MDILDILFPLLAIGAYFFFNSKKKSQKDTPPKPFEKEYDFEQYEEEKTPQYMWSEIEQIDKKDPFLSQKEQYASFDHSKKQREYQASNIAQNDEDTAQDIDNKEEIIENISFELEDLKKAVIYSEILKRPYN